jgi:ABC-2 type transport system permease protein
MTGLGSLYRTQANSNPQLMTKTNYFIDTMWREFHRFRRDRTLQFITIAGPLFAFFLVAWIFSANVPRDLTLAVVDLDHTAFSRQMARMIDATSIADVNRNFTNLKEAQKAVEEGVADAVLCIPDGSEKDIYRGKSAKIALYLNNSNVLKGGMLNTGIRKAISTMSAGIKMQVQMKNGRTQDQALSRVMPVQLRQVLLFNPYTSYSYYLTAAVIPVMLIVFVLLGTIYIIGDELYRGAGPRWIRGGGGNFLIALAGKLLPYTLVYFSLAMVMNLILFKKLGMPLHGNFYILLTGEFLLILCYQSLAIFMVGVTSNLRLSLSLGSAYSMLALTYSGLTFPVFGMAPVSQVFASVFPYTYWIRILVSQSLRGEPVQHTIMPLLAMVVFIAFGLLFIPLLRYMLLNRRRWGKI